MINEIAGRAANESLNGGKTKFITTIEDPIVSIHGSVAVASFVRGGTFILMERHRIRVLRLG